VTGVTVYAIAQLTIHDRPRYEQYVAGFQPVIEQYGGSVLAADDRPRVAEGEWHGDRVVLMSFPDRDTFARWATSPEYEAIAGHRRAAAETVVLLVRGL
jgi:uncharacterized protein (DUF1330 family)